MTPFALIDPSAFIHESAVVDEGAHLGADVKVWHFAHVMPGARLGAGTSLGQGCYVASTVRLGRNVKVQNNVSLYDGVSCDDDVFLGPSCVFTNVRNPRSAVNRRGEYEPTHVGPGATVGANATVRCGVSIGAYAIVLGVPAKSHGWMSAHGERLQFDPEGMATCPATGDVYALRDGRVTPIPKP